MRLWGRDYQCAAVMEHKPRLLTVNCIKGLPDGRWVSGGDDNLVRMWRSDGTEWDGQLGPILKGHTDRVLCIDILANPERQVIISGSVDRTIHLWDFAGKPGRRILGGHTDWIFCMKALPDGGLVTGSLDGTCRIWTEKEIVENVPVTLEVGPRCDGHKQGVLSVDVLPNGLIASGSDDRSIRTWHVDGTPAQCFRGHIGAVFQVKTLP